MSGMTMALGFAFILVITVSGISLGGLVTMYMEKTLSDAQSGVTALTPPTTKPSVAPSSAAPLTTTTQSHTSGEVYFQCDFTNSQGITEIPMQEPCIYTPSKGLWNWVDVYPITYSSGSIFIITDPANSAQTCSKFILDTPETQPLTDNQHCKLYEVQSRQSADYAGDYTTNKEGWYNFKIWIPSDFSVADWRILWQSYGDPVPSSGTGGPQVALAAFADKYLSWGGICFTIGARATQSNYERRFQLMPNASFPKNRWVQVSIYWKQGTHWKTQDGVITIWIDGSQVFSRNDLETATESGSPYNTWGIGNYGSYLEAFGQYILFKEVNVSSQMDTGK